MDVICVCLIKSVDKTEKDQLKECFVQNVTQCYNTFITGRIKDNSFKNGIETTPVLLS